MLTTPRKNRGSRSYTTPQKVSLKGFFQDGVWHCNCKPRLPASHFLVRKPGPNKGRGFYTCQEPKGRGCGFFLWDEDTAGREMGAVLSNSRSEPGAVSEGADVKSGSTPDRMTVEGHIEASNNLMADIFKKEQDEYGEWPLSAADEGSLVAHVEEELVHKTPQPYPETPRKAIKLEKFSTPGNKMKAAALIASWPTPSDTGPSEGGDIFTRPSEIQQPRGIFDRYERSGLMSPSVTPLPLRFRDIDPQPIAEGVTSDPKDYDITQEVMEILEGQSLEEEISVQLREVLKKHALRTQGVARGRDVTRSALKSKDTKIAELQQRITALEAEREMDKRVIKHFKTDMAHSISRRGRGRGRSPG